MQIKQTKSFERELKKLVKKHFPITVLKPCLKAIVKQDVLVLKQIKDHALKGNWRGYREFHPARYGNYGKKFIPVASSQKNKFLIKPVKLKNQTNS